MTAITYPGTGRVVNRTYDGTGRLKTVTDWLANQTKFAYDVNSNLKTITFPAVTGLVDTFTYDRAGHMRTAGFAKGGVDVASYTYGRDDASDVASVAGVSLTGVLGESHAYDYSDTGQLQRVDTGQYAYDPADNMVAFPSGASQLFDAANQLCWSVPGALPATPSRMCSALTGSAERGF